MTIVQGVGQQRPALLHAYPADVTHNRIYMITAATTATRLNSAPAACFDETGSAASSTSTCRMR
jgi:hypothetical protein